MKSGKLVQIESGVQRWALAFVGGKDTGDQPKSCFNCPFLYINQKRCQIHGPDIVIDRVSKGGDVYTPVCCYQRGGTPLAVGDDQVVYNVTTLGEKAADQTGLEWAKSPTGTNCGGFKQGASCEHFVVTDGKGVVGVCALMADEQDETSNAMSEHRGRSVDWDDCCDGHEGKNMPWREAQKLMPTKHQFKSNFRSEENMAKKHHKVSHTHIEHHHDGSHTVTHHMDGGGTMSSAHGDLDGVHDKLQDTLGQPNPGEAAADMGQHGVPAPMAGMAGLPMGQ